MGYPDSNNGSPEGGFPDGISCVGILLIAALLVVILGAGIRAWADGRDSETTATTPITILAESEQSAAVTETVAPVTPTESPTLAPTIAEPATATPLPTSTAPTIDTPTPSAVVVTLSIPTNTPSSTASVQPTESPTESPTETPKLPPLPTPFGVYSWTLKVPIMMYHYISEPPEDADVYRVDLSVTPEDFRAQLQYLVDNGYEAIDLYDLSLAIVNKRELPPKPVIITLDDGYRDNYENAFPILKEMGLTATFFIPTDFIDKGDPNYMTWEMVEEMAEAGMRPESHSKTHPDLRDQERDFLVWEILGSQETLEAHIGYRPRYFAYPGGRYDEAVIEVLDEIGVWGAVVTAGGKWHGFNDRFEWTRIRIRNTTTLEELADLVG